MLKNYLKTAWRSLMRKKAFSILNIFGLAVGLTCFLLISAFVYDEISYDRYAENYNNIYRVGLQLEQNGRIDNYPHVDVAVANGMKNTFPEIDETVRITSAITDYVRHEDVNMKEEGLVFADSNFFRVFTIPLLEGDEVAALKEPNSIVVSKAFAKKYFGDGEAVGQLLTLQRYGVLKVTGIFDKIPERSHFHYQAIISMTTGTFTTRRQTWSNVGFFTYLSLHPKASAEQLESKFPLLVRKYVVPEVQEDMGISLSDAEKSVDSWKFYLMPLSKIHLYSNTKYEIEPNGDINNVYIFSALAIFVLLLACINFMNLATATSARRSKEIGIRKVLGSLKGNLVAQFLTESIILSLISILLALLVATLLVPLFNDLTGKNLTSDYFLSPALLLAMLTLGIVVGALAGIYPAAFLSSFNILKVLKGDAGRNSDKGTLRSTLVVFQFAISTGLIIAALVAYQQLSYLQNIDLGYNKEQVLVLDNARGLASQSAFRETLKQDPRISNVSSANLPIGNASSFPGAEVSAKENTAATVHMTFLYVDDNYLTTLGMELLKGRDFSPSFPSDSLGTNVIINETAMKDLGWSSETVIGSTIIRSAKQSYQVVGVVKDFHYTSAKIKIAPLMLVYREAGASMMLRVNTQEVGGLITDLEKRWKAFNAELPFSYYFLDERFNKLYQSEQRVKQIFIVFMTIALMIASLGLYGLSAYSAEQRVKEIGIRKVLGSTVPQIVILQCREFLLLVILSILLATPITWWLMHQWLQGFGYRIEMNPEVVIIAGVGVICIALLTVSFQAIRAALVNPIKSLRQQ